MKIGYVRVSKSDGTQVLDLQMDALLKSGVQLKNIYKDKASGKLDDRPGLEGCLKALRKGDVLVVWKLDRGGTPGTWSTPSRICPNGVSDLKCLP